MLVGFALFLLLLVALLTALLAIPVAMKFNITRKDKIEGTITLLWLFGLVRRQIPLFQTVKTVPEQPQESAKKNKKQNRKKPARQTNNHKTAWFSLLRNTPLRRHLFKFLSDLWKAIRKEKFKLHLRIGLGDPADTGQLWAFVGPLSGMLAQNRTASIAIEPEFIDPCLELDSSGKIVLVPLQVMLLIMGLLLSPTLWKTVYRLRIQQA